MSSVIPLLSNVKVAAPCSASWQSMEAIDGDRVPFCGECKKNVYNLSPMTQTQAEGLLREHEGHLCVRYYQRTDGTILTQNCPVGHAALRMKMIAKCKQAAVAAAFAAAYFYSGRVVVPEASMGLSLGYPSAPERHFAMLPKKWEIVTGDATDSPEPDGVCPA